jgi:hypothetical protein
MNARRLLALTLTLALAGLAGSAMAGDDGKHAPDMPPQLKVTPEFQRLHRLAGTWDVTMKMWHGPGEPHTEKGTSTAQVVLDGLGISYDFKSASGFGGHGFTTWNPAKKQYEAVWMDTMSHAGPTYSTGIWNEKDQTMVETMTSTMPDGSTQQVTSETKWVSDDKQVLSFFMDQGGKRTKSMELTYIRKGKRPATKGAKAAKQKGGK